tara:strand:- start:7262 stop:7708 length:447 start_codon:yes stop_codon:yes gene_type:complete
MSTFIKGDTLILYVYDTTLVAYEPIACLTSNSLAQTLNVIESQTKCDPGLIEKTAGSTSYEWSFEGQYIDTSSVGAVVTSASHDTLMTKYQAKSVITWKVDTGLADTASYYGTGLISDLSLDASAGDEIATFSGTISGIGTVGTTVLP